MVKKALVLMYHRITDLTYDPWQLAVSPSNFEQQLQVLKKNYNLISVSELVSYLKKKSIPSNAVCITFDDGYRDNFTVAKPLLEKYECPATFFISSQYIEHQKEFWWDELQDIILGSEKLQKELSLTINGELVKFQLENDIVLTNEKNESQKSWVYNEEPPTERCRLYLELWKLLKPLPYAEIQSSLEKIKVWAGYHKVINENLPMTKQQLREFANHKLFDLGLHTVTHLSLPFHSREVQFEEITENDQFLKNNCQMITKLFAYPYGDYDEATTFVARDYGLDMAFTTQGQTISKQSNIYSLGRFSIENWKGDKFEKQLKKYLKKT